MPLPPLDTDALHERLSGLSPAAQRAFGALCAARLLPGYRAFQAAAHWGDVDALSAALALAWTDIGGTAADPGRVRAALDACEAVTPDADEFALAQTPAAQDAGFAVCNLLDHLLDPRPEHIVHIAVYAVESIDRDAGQDRAGTSAVDTPMQRELAAQAGDLSAVSGVNERHAADPAQLANALLSLRV